MLRRCSIAPPHALKHVFNRALGTGKLMWGLALIQRRGTAPVGPEAVGEIVSPIPFIVSVPLRLSPIVAPLAQKALSRRWRRLQDAVA